MADTLLHWIDGKEFSGSTGRFGDVFDPAVGAVRRQVALAGEEDVHAAVSAATRAFPGWRGTSLSRRTEVMFAFREILNARKEELAAIVTAEHGKIVSDALAEIRRGLEVAEFACGIPHLLKGEFSESASTKVDVHSIRQPLGPVAIITPFNFPVMVPLWFIPIAIATGNTVILKPSEKDPSASDFVARAWSDAGLPAGVLNVVHGEKEAVDSLLKHPGVKAVSFVGSTPIAKYIYATAAAYGKRVQALGGAKNHMLVLPDADLDLAADAAVNAGYGSAGERCMAVSVVVAMEQIADALVQRIAERACKIQTGDGRRGSDMGPLVTGAHRDKVTGYVAAGVSSGANLIVDGRTADVDGEDTGFWLGPTLFDRVDPEMSIYKDEIFGPVLSVVRVGSMSDAIELINANSYGNGATIFTSDGGAARRFSVEIEAGMVGVNIPVPAPMAYYSFGGWGASLFGDMHAHGTEGVRFFTRAKVVTTRWPDASHHGLDLRFPQNH